MYKEEGKPSHLVKMSPEVFKSARDGGDKRKQFTAPDRDMSVN